MVFGSELLKTGHQFPRCTSRREKRGTSEVLHGAVLRTAVITGEAGTVVVGEVDIVGVEGVVRVRRLSRWVM